MTDIWIAELNWNWKLWRTLLSSTTTRTTCWPTNTAVQPMSALKFSRLTGVSIQPDSPTAGHSASSYTRCLSGGTPFTTPTRRHCSVKSEEERTLFPTRSHPTLSVWSRVLWGSSPPNVWPLMTRFATDGSRTTVLWPIANSLKQPA